MSNRCTERAQQFRPCSGTKDEMSHGAARRMLLKVHLGFGIVAFECFATSFLFWIGLPHQKSAELQISSYQITQVWHNFLSGFLWNRPVFFRDKTADSAFAFNALDFPFCCVMLQSDDRRCIFPSGQDKKKAQCSATRKLLYLQWLTVPGNT